MTDQTPSLGKPAFTCPSCGVFTSQSWYRPFVERYVEESRAPFAPTTKFAAVLQIDKEAAAAEKSELTRWAEKKLEGLPFFDSQTDGRFLSLEVANLSINQCYGCQKVSVWVHDRLVFPLRKSGPAPHPDLPEAVKKRFEEARCVLEASPGAAAAIMRLCAEMLILQLGENPADVNAAIANLLKRGMNPLLAQSLEALRVTGAEAVGAGLVDFGDEREIAVALFDLVNSIADQMIAQPKKLSELLDASRKRGSKPN